MATPVGRELTENMETKEAKAALLNVAGEETGSKIEKPEIYCWINGQNQRTRKH